MITRRIVQYRLPPSDRSQTPAPSISARSHRVFRAPCRGLIRKQFIYAEDGWAGGVYLWESRARTPDAFYTGSLAPGHPPSATGMDRRSSSFTPPASPTMRSRRLLLPDAAE